MRENDKTTLTTKRERLLAWAAKWNVILQIVTPSIFSALIIFVIIVHAFLYRSQWRAMVEQDNLTRESLYEGKKTREIENAAYLGIKDTRLREPIEFYKIQYAQLIVENTGNTPALNARVAAVMEFRRTLVPEPMPLPTFTSTEQKGVSVLPHGAEYSMDIKTTKLTPQELETIRTEPENWRVYLYGRTTYEDVFGNSYQLDFCLVNRSDDSVLFTSCPNNNSFKRQAKQEK
jgi:hypothetical protein